MSYCSKCGNKVDETMAFCPRCGASLKTDSTTAAGPAPSPPTYRRDEKSEKGEKREKNEPEKGEKGEHGFVGYLIAGIIVIAIGLLAYANAVGYIAGPIQGAVILLVIGIAIIIVAIWLSTTARRRYPTPSST
jgi:hypothetical protein